MICCPNCGKNKPQQRQTKDGAIVECKFCKKILYNGDFQHYYLLEEILRAFKVSSERLERERQRKR